MKTDIRDLPIQVKALAPLLRDIDPDIWKCNSLKECIGRIGLPIVKFVKDGRQFVMEFKNGSVAGEFLTAD